jgi:predicted hotdog family 3-hydroxylacyl-ACP dehydratase
MQNTNDLTVKNLLLHRGRMLLVKEILTLNDDRAVTLSIAGKQWPLYEDGSINPLVMVELVAQTAGVHNGLKFQKKRGEKSPARGWLVGVKKARFHVDGIVPGEPVITTTVNAFVFENLREIRGTATINGRPAAEVVLQVMEEKS